MKVRGLMWLISALLLAVAGTWGVTAEEDEEPSLKDKFILNPKSMVPNDYVAFSPDGKTLLTFGMGTRYARLWDVAGQKTIAVLRHRGSRVIIAAAFSPDGKTIATAEYEGEIWIWDAKNGEKITSFVGHKEINKIIYGSDGRTLSTDVRGELFVYDLAQESPILFGRLLSSRKLVPGRRFNALRPVNPSRVMKRPLIGLGAELYDVVTGDLRYRISGGVFCSVHCTAITADEKKVAIGGKLGPIHIFDTKEEVPGSGKFKYLALKHPEVTVRCLAFSPDEQILAAGYVYESPPPGVGIGHGGVLLFDVSSGKLLVNQDARISAVNFVAFSPDSRLLATVGHYPTIKLWEVPAAWRKKSK